MCGARDQSSRSAVRTRKARLGEPYMVVVVVLEVVVDVTTVELVVVVVATVAVVVGAAVVVVGAAVVVVLLVDVVVVVGPDGQTPSVTGLVALNSVASLFVILLSGPNSTL